MRAAAIWGIVGWTVAAGAAPKPKIAALILKSGAVDEELADNLTEVLIGRIARRGDHEIAGKEELKSKLGVDERTAADCMQNLGCLGRAGTELGVTRMVVGTLGKRGSDYLYNLSLIDISTGKIENRVFEMVAGGKVDALILAVQSTADKLFLPKIEPGGVKVVSETRGAMVYLDDAFIGASPVRRDGVEPGTHALRIEKEGHTGWAKDIEVPAGMTLQVKVPLAALPERRKWPANVAIAGLVFATAAGVVGAVLLALSQNAPGTGGVTRKDAVQSVNDRFVEGRIGIGLLGGGAGLAVSAGILAIVFRRDMFGSTTRETIKQPRTGVGVAPLAGGVAITAMVRW